MDSLFGRFAITASYLRDERSSNLLQFQHGRFPPFANLENLQSWYLQKQICSSIRIPIEVLSARRVLIYINGYEYVDDPHSNIFTSQTTRFMQGHFS